MRKYFVILALIVSAIAAGLILKYKPYEPLLYNKKTPSGVPYRRLQHGSGAAPTEGQYLAVQLSIAKKTAGGGQEMLFDTEKAQSGMPMFLQLNEAMKKSTPFLHEVGSMLKGGDQIGFKATLKELQDTFFKGRFMNLFYYLRFRKDVSATDVIYLTVDLEAVLNEDELEAFSEKRAEEIQKKQAEQAKKQLKKERKEIDDYIKEYDLASQGEVVESESGLRYVIRAPGEGPKPAEGATAQVRYTGKKLDGTVFDTNVEEVAKKHSLHQKGRKYQPLQVVIGSQGIIAGVHEAVKMLPKGGKGTFILPSPLAYGPSAPSEAIGENAILVFDLEVIDILPKAEEEETTADSKKEAATKQ